ncbi:hypothetical protein BDV59DRAFT_187326 [Aspergillus ambiguus]|uniref:DUF3984 domain-containing protein n=1 Tax=Aspergillus ambiguus TaxID=176160 RepID=UPI003CCD7757
MDLSRSPSGFRSRRSYPSLNHISLAPLTPRFPLDDDYDDEPQDYFSPRDDQPPTSAYTGYDTPPRTSYLTSFSVPGTPGVLSHSHSRSGSRARPQHQRSKSTTRENLSDTNLQGHGAAHPLHQQQQHHHHRTKRSRSQHQSGDTEWMLRAASALASSAREEKGQSWLAKRASSTSLISDAANNSNNGYDADSPSAHGRSNRRSRSGRSTPAAHSRRGSLSRTVSRRGSRLDLAMTGLEMTVPDKAGEGVRGFVPDFVDEGIQAEMEWIRQEEEAGGYLSASSEGYFDSEEDMDEQEFQRLTRERGFGLGSWVDRVVGWTVFGDDDWPWASATGPVEESSKPVDERSAAAVEQDDSGSVSSVGDDADGVSVSDAERQSVVEKPGEAGGWEDAGWLFRTMRRAFF